MLTLALALLVGAGPTPTAPPVVSGDARDGGRLTATSGTWVADGAVSYAFQWYRCNPRGSRCATVTGATAQAYRPGPRDVGASLALTVVATDAAGASVSYAPLVGVVARANEIVPTRRPALTGPPVVGRPLSVEQPERERVTYAWLRCDSRGRECALLPKSTSPTYTPVAEDAGHVLVAQLRDGRVRVLSANLGPTRLAPGPLAQAPPAIAGAFQSGRRLTATAGIWSARPGVRYRYQWYRCDGAGARCGPIRGATTSTYTQGARDVGGTLGLTVHATDSTGTTAAYSSLAGPVARATKVMFAVDAPVLEGVPAIGRPLHIGHGGWHYPPRSFSYAWLRCNAGARACTPIAGATGSTYVPVSDDRGHALVARVTAAIGRATQPVLTTAVTVPLD